MSTFFADYPVTGGGVTSLNGLTGNLTLIGAGGITIIPGVPGASDITIDGSGLANIYATRSLNNLTNPTAVNQSLFFNMAGPSVIETQGHTAPAGVSQILLVGTGDGDASSGTLFLSSGNSNSGDTGSISLTTGDGNTSSGSIILNIGAGTVPGTIQFNDGSQGTAGYVWTSKDINGSGTWLPASVGTVTSVGFADGSTSPIFSISGSPVTSSGTITETLVTQSANKVFAGPTSGGAAQPAFRSLVSADIPSLAYANQSLSNLTNPTSINQSLLPNAAGSLNFGSNSLPWFGLFSSKLTLVDSSVITRTNIITGSNTTLGMGGTILNPALTIVGVATANADMIIQSINNAAGNLWLGTGNAANTGNSGNVTIYSGSGGSVSGNSGNIILTPSAVTSGTRGKIQFQDGTQGTSGQVWTSTDTSGSGAWMSAATGATDNKELFTLSSGDITNQFIDLAHVAKTNSIDFIVRGAGSQIEGASFDYSVNYTGGAGGNTRITFLNGLATGGVSALIAGDVVVAQYQF